MPQPVRSLHKTSDLMTELGADPALTATVIDAVGELIRKSRRTDRRLLDPERVPLDRMAKAIAKAGQCTVSRVTAVPKRTPFPRGKDMSDEDYARLVRGSIGLGATEGVSGRVVEKYRRILEGSKHIDALMKVHDRLWYDVRPHLARWAYEDFADGLSGRADDLMETVVRNLFGFALIGYSDGLDAFLPLARLMTSAVPVGRSPKNDDEWIVLAG